MKDIESIDRVIHRDEEDVIGEGEPEDIPCSVEECPSMAHHVRDERHESDNSFTIYGVYRCHLGHETRNLHLAGWDAANREGPP